jgi:fused signal recognition particle receptor
MTFWNKIFKRKDQDVPTQIEQQEIQTVEQSIESNQEEQQSVQNFDINQEVAEVVQSSKIEQAVSVEAKPQMKTDEASKKENGIFSDETANLASDAQIESVKVEPEFLLEKEGTETNKKQTLSEDAILDVKESIAKDKIFSTKIEKSHKNFGQRLKLIFSSKKIIDEDLFEEIEETLIENDLNANLVMQLVEKLKEEVRINKIKEPDELKELFTTNLIQLYSFSDSEQKMNIENEGLNVIYFVGVNGAGKTTTVGKLAQKYKDQGKKVMVAAADTFRAGAVAQLQEWANRVGVECYFKQDNADPGAVVYEAIQKAQSENYDILLCDTSGRLQSKENLMQELNRIVTISKKHSENYPHEVLLVIDGNTGQNGLLQAKAFKEKALLTGLIITKLDGTAKGGVAFSVKTQLNIPIKYIGVGESASDLLEFNLEDFAKSLLGENFDR